MNKRARALIEYGKLCGFELEGIDGNEHYVLVHPSGARYRVAGTPGDRRGDENAKADMRRLSGVTPPRPNSGRHRKGVGTLRAHRPAEVRVDSRSHQLALLQQRFREVCDRIGWCRDEGDRDGAEEAVAELLEVEEEFTRLGVTPPVRQFRVYEPRVEREDG